ncbi:Trm112 family protein [Alteromonadaceae bacterium BrNp21-10]|nr:Trm112 family protein [Alteromonadaceae bacterium BrNp21-10]
MAFDKSLLDILACPACKGKLQYVAQKDELVCRFDKLAYPINTGIPVLIETEARHVEMEELESLR